MSLFYKKKFLLAIVLFTINAFLAFSQTTIQVSGTVSDETGEPVIGATVYPKGFNQRATITDVDGKFKLSVPEEAKKLVVSYVGMETQEVNVEPIVKVVLKTNAKQLKEVEIVSTGYQNIDRKMFTGSAVKVGGEDAKVDGATDVSKMLQGKAAGVQVSNVSGTFGAAPKLRVRGPSSIYGNSTPLWVVDGVVLDEVVNIDADDLASGNAETLISSGVAGLNADDIEAFQILKDASATALYGARAMNGVIVITTKKGNKGRATFNYTGELTTRLKPSYSQYDILNSKDQMDVLLEMKDKGLMPSQSMFLVKNGGVFNKYYQLTDLYSTTNGQFGLANTDQAFYNYMQAAEMRNTDWFDELFRNTVQQSHSLSMSVGGEKANAYVSGSFYNDPGWTAADKVNRWTFNAKGSYDFSKKLKLTVSGNSSWRTQKAPGTLTRNYNPVEGEYSRDFDINPFSYALNASRTMASRETYRMNYASFNIFNEMENNYLDLDVNDMTIQADVSYKPIKDLDINILGAHRYAKTTRTHNILDNSNMAMAYRADESASIISSNNFLWQDPDNPNEQPVVVMPNGGFYNTNDNLLKSYYGRVSGNYNFGVSDFKFNILGGAEIRSADRLSRYAMGYGYLWASEMAVTDYRMLRKIIDAGDTYYGMAQTFDRSAGFFAAGTTSYKGIYTLNATIRTEGSNQMGQSTQARWLPTWNISGAWNIREEDFLSGSLDFMSTLKLRGTYGLTAKMISGVNADAVYNAMLTFRPYQYDREVGYEISNLANTALTWEKMKETNLGVDFGLLRDRISLIFDIYWRNSFDLIGYMRNAGYGGESMKVLNYANMESNGFEFSLNTVNIKNRSFEWTNNFIFSFNKNTITDMENIARIYQLTSLDGYPREGYAHRGLFSIPFAGLDEDGVPTFWAPNESNPHNADGSYNMERVYYINLQEQEDLDWLKYEGSIDPKITGGFENSLKYKGLKLDLYFTYQFGSVIRLYPNVSYSYSDMTAMTQDIRDRWTLPGDENYTNMPGIPSLDLLRNNGEAAYAYNAYNFSDIRVVKGDFIRLKDITLSYDLPKRTIDKFNIDLNKLSFRFVASNMWLIYSDKRLNGQDPEFSRSGGVAMPTPKQFTLSIRAGF